MLCFEVLEDGKKIQVFCDKDGMATLIENLASLVRLGGHTHLWGPSGGGQALSEVTPFGDPAVSEVIIDFNPNYD
jgi:hypothetical protein